MKHLGQDSEAILTMEDALKLGFNEGKALYCMAKIKGKEKDFYEANYMLNRIKIINDPKIVAYKKLIEGVYYIIIIDIINDKKKNKKCN